MNLKQVPINQVRTWENNPRGLKRADFARLKNQIQKLKVFKPLVVCEDGGSGYLVLGGNMRLRAYQELGYSEVWISVVEAPDEQTKLEYALADNDRAGYYEQDKLAELVGSSPNLDLELYHIDIGETVPVEDILEKYGPGEAPTPPKMLYQVVIDCDSEAEQKEVVDKLESMDIEYRTKKI